MKNNKLAVSEYFYSLQGEGKTMGIPAIFLRLAGCNLICGGHGVERDGKMRDGATWICDTIQVWMHGKSMNFEVLTQKLQEKLNFIQRLQEGVHLVITGGEPLMQQERILQFLIYLDQKHKLRPIIEVETNATVLPLPRLDNRVHYWNTSPKLSNSGMKKEARIYPEILKWFAQNEKTMSKFVISHEKDFEEIQNDFLIPKLIKKNQIVLMPSADSIKQLLQNNQLVANICIQHQIRMCTRMHVEIWNQLTGV